MLFEIGHFCGVDIKCHVGHDENNMNFVIDVDWEDRTESI